MGYHPRIESKDLSSFLTTRSRNSELWFINNDPLVEAILGYAAKFSTRYGVKLYGLAIEGNHIQGPALFPEENRSNFMRDFNSCVARAVPRYAREYPGGRFWSRRYSSEFLPAAEDIEEYFFYTALQPVNDGLVEKISDYPGYNFFHDAVNGISRRFKVINWAKYNSAKRYNPQVPISSFTDIVTLSYERIPGYENLTQKEYAKLMYEKLEMRRLDIVKKRRERGQGFAGRAALKAQRRGSRPVNTKRSTFNSHRPRILSVCDKRRAEYKAWYFDIFFQYIGASRSYRDGNVYAVFPEGTYRPWVKYKPPPEFAT